MKPITDRVEYQMEDVELILQELRQEYQDDRNFNRRLKGFFDEMYRLKEYSEKHFLRTARDLDFDKTIQMKFEEWMNNYMHKRKNFGVIEHHFEKLRGKDVHDDFVEHLVDRETIDGRVMVGCSCHYTEPQITEVGEGRVVRRYFKEYPRGEIITSCEYFLAAMSNRLERFRSKLSQIIKESAPSPEKIPKLSKLFRL